MTLSASERADNALAARSRPAPNEVFISTASYDQLVAQAARHDTLPPESTPLAGLTIAVKDNIDVAGLPTTAACPSSTYRPVRSAVAVELLAEAGALIVGKTNLDQFATGLVGTRSPYGAVPNALRPGFVSGGSSSGSAVAVALGLVDAALGTDTAGSGRVPAGFNHLVGVKPTLGLVSNRGVVPACRSYDTVSVFARTLSQAVAVLNVMVKFDPEDPRSRTWPETTPLAAPAEPIIGIPRVDQLDVAEPAVRAAFEATCDRLRDLGCRLVDVDFDDLLATARLLYDGGLVAERYEAFGAFADEHPAALDPAVAAVIDAARAVPGWQVVRDQHRLRAAQRRTTGLFATVTALAVPTSPIHPTQAAVAADPMGLNSTIGTFTNFVNLLDLAAVAVPGSDDPTSTVDGVTFIVPAFHDQVALDLASKLVGETVGLLPTAGVDVMFFGAHMRGLPLSPQLVALGGRFLREAETAPGYRMGLIEGALPRPGVTSVPHGGRGLPGEIWRLPSAAIPPLVGDLLSPPLGLGRVTLADGSQLLGCLSSETPAVEITDGWRDWLSRSGG